MARDGYKAVFEVSSVNSRYLEVSLRLPRWLLRLELPLKSLVDKRLSRGKVFCQLSLEKDDAVGAARLNEPLAEWYITRLRDLADRHNLDGGVSVSDLVRLPDLWAGEVEGPDEALEGVLSEALGKALDGLVEVRSAEGNALAKDLSQRLATIRSLVEEVKAEAAGVPEAIREKLTARIEELFGQAEYDPQRVAQEVAYLAERADITEEFVRLDVHCTHFEEALNSEKAVGRRLNFLLQEMNRETNTIGSKSATAGNSSRVVELKEELERIREQIQNIE